MELVLFTSQELDTTRFRNGTDNQIQIQPTAIQFYIKMLPSQEL